MFLRVLNGPADSQTVLWGPKAQLLPVVLVGPEGQGILEHQQYQEHP